MNVKVWAAISLIVNIIAGIFLLVWRDDDSKTAVTNAIEKIINSLLQILVLLKGFFFKEKKNVKDEEEVKKIEPAKKAMEFIKKIADEKTAIEEFDEFVEKNQNTQDAKIKDDVKSVAKALIDITKEAENIIEKLKYKTNKYKQLII